MKPILFNTEMVRAIQGGTKTATRRVIKLHYDNTHIEWHKDKYGRCLVEVQNNVEGETYGVRDDGTHWQKVLEMREIKPPYKVGDILYVRETFAQPSKNIFWYKADDNPLLKDILWKPSIHMPKEAARIFLRVTDVRVERLQAMTVDDCLKEGATALPPPICRGEISFPKGFEHLTKEKQDDWIEAAARARYIGWCDFTDELFRAMSLIWNSTIKKSDLNKYGWEANPWVWVIEFERMEVTK